MSEQRQSHSFKINLFFLKLFGLWPGVIPVKYYRYYSAIFLLITLCIYVTLLTLNLFYTPHKVELLIHEVVFIFTEIVVIAKVIMIRFKWNEILQLFEILDCESFKGDDDSCKKIIEKNGHNYKKYWKSFALLCNVAYIFLVILPLAVHWILNTKLELPVCKYYFLSDEFRDKYVMYLFIYQSYGIFIHMMYNVNVDTFIGGMILMIITQLRVINHKLSNLKVENDELKLSIESREKLQIERFNKILRHYDIVLKMVAVFQSFISATMFVQFGVASLIICVTLCGIILPSSTENLIFNVSYLFAMWTELFAPAFLGSQLSHESEKLAFAAYSGEWIPRSESYKQSYRIFVTRTNKPIVLTGLSMFPLTLSNFTNILKTAYSFFTLVRNVQDREEHKVL